MSDNDLDAERDRMVERRLKCGRRDVTANQHEEGRLTVSPPPMSWRYRIGIWMFWAPVAMFFGATVLVPALGLSAVQTAGLAGAIMVLSHVVWFASIPLLGKAGFKSMKNRALGLLTHNRVARRVFDGLSVCVSVLSSRSRKH
jgi:hypothetical protein